MTKIPPFVRIDTDDAGQPTSVELVDEVPDDALCIICTFLTVPLLVPDNLVGLCAGCHCAIQFRPVASQLPRVCMNCAVEWAEGAARPQ